MRNIVVSRCSCGNEHQFTHRSLSRYPGKDNKDQTPYGTPFCFHCSILKITPPCAKCQLMLVDAYLPVLVGMIFNCLVKYHISRQSFTARISYWSDLACMLTYLLDLTGRFSCLLLRSSSLGTLHRNSWESPDALAMSLLAYIQMR